MASKMDQGPVVSSAQFDKPLAFIAVATDTAKLRQIISNTIKRYGEPHIVVQAGRERLAELLGPEGVLAEEYDAMRRATIQVTGNDARLSTLRRKRTVVDALEYLMAQPPSGAFGKLIAAGRAEETAETIIVRHPEHFTPAAVATARSRLDVGAESVG